MFHYTLDDFQRILEKSKIAARYARINTSIACRVLNALYRKCETPYSSLGSQQIFRDFADPYNPNVRLHYLSTLRLLNEQNLILCMKQDKVLPSCDVTHRNFMTLRLRPSSDLFRSLREIDAEKKIEERRLKKRCSEADMCLDGEV